MFSRKSLQNFFLVNSVISTISVATQKLCSMFNNSFPIVLGTELLKNTFLIQAMDYRNRNKPKIDESYEIEESYPHEFKLNVLGATMVKACTHYVILNSGVLAPSVDYGVVAQCGIFFIKSFAFEIFFDLGHYWMHRLLHSHPTLYKSIHKQHHKFLHPSAQVAFYINPIDLALSYTIPVAFAMYMIPLTPNEFACTSTYLTYQEIGGHLGKKMAPTSSFAQCIWLPRIWNIQLYTEDHDLHHSHFNYNYSKRFTLWDKVFGTYKKPSSIEIIS